MAASEIQHKRWSQDVAGENRKECLRDKGRYDAFTIKEDANVKVTSTRISSTRMRNNTSQGFFVHMHGQINTSVICRENRVVCIANGLFVFCCRPCHFRGFAHNRPPPYSTDLNTHQRRAAHLFNLCKMPEAGSLLTLPWQNHFAGLWAHGKEICP